MGASHSLVCVCVRVRARVPWGPCLNCRFWVGGFGWGLRLYLSQEPGDADVADLRPHFQEPGSRREVLTLGVASASRGGLANADCQVPPQSLGFSRSRVDPKSCNSSQLAEDASTPGLLATPEHTGP